MAIDTTPSQVATSALQALPFGNIIGGPLKACIEAQAMAAKTSWNFIQEVGADRSTMCKWYELSCMPDVYTCKYFPVAIRRGNHVSLLRSYDDR